MIIAVALIGLVLADAAPLASAPPAIPPAFFGTHRERFLAKVPAGSIAVFHAAAETTVETSPDPYRQSSDFWYLTGLSEPESVCVLVPASEDPPRDSCSSFGRATSRPSSGRDGARVSKARRRTSARRRIRLRSSGIG